MNLKKKNKNFLNNFFEIKNLSKLFLILFFLLGITIHKDYGLSWDEPFQRAGGIANLVYIYEFFNIANFLSIFFDTVPQIPENLSSLEDWKNENHLQRFYGVAFDLPAVILEYFFFGINENDQKIYEFRHLLTFIIFFIGIYFIKAQSKKLFSSNLLGLVAIVLLILSPRFFAEAFYNSKDIIFMSLLSTNIYFLIKILKKTNLKYLIIISFITALSINLRVIGVLFYPLTLFVLIFANYCKIIDRNKLYKIALIYLITSTFLTIIFFPYLWSNPIENFIEAINTMSNFPVQENSNTLYFGEWISLRNLPWHYLPSWILITTPPFIIFLFFFGLIKTIKDLLNRPIKKYSSKEIFLITNFLIIITPILAIIILNAKVYNGWRHIYFIYPSIIIISTYGFKYFFEILINFNFGKFICFASFFMFIIYQSFWIFKTHPMQNVYFNSFVNKTWNTQFDLDYWGLGNKIVLEDLLSKDSNETIKVCPISYTPLKFTFKILNMQSQKRIELNCIDKPDYLIDNFYYALGKNKYNKQRKELNIKENYIVFNNLKNFEQKIITVYKKK